jgi:hypothetical protein
MTSAGWSGGGGAGTAISGFAIVDGKRKRRVDAKCNAARDRRVIGVEARVLGFSPENSRL